MTARYFAPRRSPCCSTAPQAINSVIEAFHLPTEVPVAASMSPLASQVSRLRKYLRMISTAASSDLTEDEKLVSRSEEHTSELQSLMRISYAVFCLKKKN